MPLCAVFGGAAGLAAGTALVTCVRAVQGAPTDVPMRRDELVSTRVGGSPERLPPVARVLVPAAGGADVVQREAHGGKP